MLTMGDMCSPWGTCAHHGGLVLIMGDVFSSWGTCAPHGGHVLTMEDMCSPWGTCAHHGGHVLTMGDMCSSRWTCTHLEGHVRDMCSPWGTSLLLIMGDMCSSWETFAHLCPLPISQGVYGGMLAVHSSITAALQHFKRLSILYSIAKDSSHFIGQNYYFQIMKMWYQSSFTK